MLNTSGIKIRSKEGIKVELTKKDKILISIALCLFFARGIYFNFIASYGITEDMILYCNIIEFITYMYIVALFALLVSLVAKLKLTKRDKILVSTILCLLFVHVVHGMLDQLGVIGYALFTDYDLPVSFFVLFVLSWLMILNSINIVFEQYPSGITAYTFFSIIAWISLFVLIIYTKGMKLAPRIVYLYLIPALVMGLAYLYSLPLN